MARYMVERNYIQVVGKIWMPNTTCAMEYPLDRFDVEWIREYGDGELTRDAVKQWLMLHSGDFQSVEDFNASIGDWESGWKSEDGQFAYQDCFQGAW